MEASIYMKKAGFTILELLVVVIIIGLLAVFYVPSMKEPLERGRAKNAEFNLLQIYSAQKRYFLSEQEYFLCDASKSIEQNVDDINRNLSIKIDDAYFDYDIRTDGSGGYRALARRKDEGKCRNKEMYLTEDNSTVIKAKEQGGCSSW